MTPVEIPSEKLVEGRRLALEHAMHLLDAATRLSIGQPIPAVVLYHAVEEVGRAVIIEEAILSHSSSLAGLGDHRAKWAAAARAVPGPFLSLRRGVFDPRIFDPRIFDVGEKLDLDARGRRLYVDWDPSKREWRKPERPEPAAFARSLAGVASLLDRWITQGRIKPELPSIYQPPAETDDR